MRPTCLFILALHIALPLLFYLSWPGVPPLVSAAQTPKTVVITGGTGGLGYAAVRYFADRGDTVFTCGRSRSNVDELNAVKGVYAAVVDVSNPESVASWAAALGNVSIDVLVNNAGVLRVGDPAAAMKVEHYAAVMDTNVRGPVTVTAAFWPRLRKPAGRVINIGSTTETPKLAQAFHTIYSMSKCALRAYSTGLRQEGRLLGIDVVHIKAGVFESNIHGAFGQASETLKQYGSPFSAFADALQKSILEKVGMMHEEKSSRFAEMLYSVAHLSGSPAAEYWFNVSMLEWIVEFVPQWILDYTIMQDYSHVQGVRAEL
eukprot:TRINITY_DN80858_c0_g1_i1.p1 TRINITY_DN80858_c0_g1~~TRINITY_DN80858_c0_g1_i1.p1  ORF type:complete len:317 (+),score=31.65 TRINITY_DN80858_c0_g1_i1:83-1033(+)